jgi:hypothetical protein
MMVYKVSQDQHKVELNVGQPHAGEWKFIAYTSFH